MRVLVTGSTGFIGRELVRHLILQGYSVVGVSRNPHDPLDEVFSKIESYCCDINDQEAMIRAMEGCDMVFHLAGLARTWTANPSDYHRYNTLGTETVLRTAHVLEVSKVIFTSTAGVCKADTGGVISERSRGLDVTSNDYERSKYLAEEICYRYADKGLNVAILNPARVYGTGNGSRSNPIPMLVRTFMRHGIIPVPGNGQAIGSYAFVQDVVEAHHQCALSGRSGENYLLGGDNVSYRDFSLILSELIPGEVRMVHIPEFMLMTASWFEKVRWYLSGHEPWIVPQWARKYLSDQIIDSRKAVQQLGYRITPLRVGLGKVIETVESTTSNQHRS